MSAVYNFCAGPAMLPAPVMVKAQSEFINWNNTGCSIMELSHRSEDFMAVASKAEADLRDLMSIPDNYKVLFCHGGGRGQFSSVPMNLKGLGDSAEFLLTGSWSKGAQQEASKFLDAKVVAETIEKDGQFLVPQITPDMLNQNILKHPNWGMDRITELKEAIKDVEFQAAIGFWLKNKYSH